MTVQTITIRNGSTVILTAKNNASMNEFLLTDKHGFDEDPQVDFTTEPKLNGAGSYDIYEHLNERLIDFSFHSMSTQYALKNTIRNLQYSFTDVLIQYTRGDGTNDNYVGKITSKNYIEVNGTSTFTIFIKCPNPIAT